MSYFGTDGIRGKFGEFPIHPQFLIKLGYATGKVLLANQAALNENHRPNVVIGKDTRLSGYVIEACLQAGFNAAGGRCAYARHYSNPCHRAFDPKFSR